MIAPEVAASTLAADLAYSTRFMGHYVAGVVAKMHDRPFLYHTATGQLTHAGWRTVRHQVLTRHSEGLLRTYESDWITRESAGA